MGLGSPIRRRTRDSGCQWVTIGMALGFGCSLVFCLSSYVAGFIEFKGLDNTGSNDGTAVVIVNTVEVTETPGVQVVTSTPSAQESPTSDIAAAVVVTEESSDAATSTPQATPLGSGSTPTRLPEVAQGSAQATTQTSQLQSDAATAVPFEGSSTITPAIGSSSIPDVLASIGTQMVTVPGGTYTMGTTREEGLAAVDACVTRDAGTCTESFIQDSTPAHQVTIDDFQMELYEVNVTQYVAFLNWLLTQNPGTQVDLIGCGGQPCVLTAAQEPNSIVRFSATQYEVVNPSFYGNHPIFFVTWYGADAYCRALGRRLPTEAEWERAARGPANSIYPWGPEWISTNANTSRSAEGSTGTQPIDSYPAGLSVYGPLNMAGNVSEWVFDFYQENYYSMPESAGPNPKGPVSSDTRVVRGGGWDNVPLFARTVHRMNVDPKQPRASLGFRCAADTGLQ
jgi:formylglycine-generating enzyme required for sulfatase activity